MTVNPTAAKEGTTVTITPVPDAGYQVGTVSVTDRFGQAVAVDQQADGTYTFVMPDGQVTVEVTFLQGEAPDLPFSDVTESDWFYDAVTYAYENGLMDGVGMGLFAPNSEATRAQLVTILYRLAGQPAPSGDSGFSDVETGTWYTDAVAWAAQNGIVNGVSDTQFAPGDDITREQLAVILYRYATYQGYDVSQRADLSGFVDAGTISTYAQEALSWANAQGLVLGFEDDSLRPPGQCLPGPDRRGTHAVLPDRGGITPTQENETERAIGSLRFVLRRWGWGYKEQLRRFPGPGVQILQLAFVVEVVGVVKVLGAHGAVLHAAVALHALAGDLVGILRIDGPQGTLLGAQAALGAGVAGLGLDREDVDGVAVAVPGGCSRGPQGVVAGHGHGDGGGGVSEALHLLEHVVGEACGDGQVADVRPAGVLARGEGVLAGEGRPGHGMEPPSRRVLRSSIRASS